MIVKITFDDDIDIDELAAQLDGSRAGDHLLTLEDVTPTESTDERWIGYAHIYLPAASAGSTPTLYASCPMTPGNLPLLERWLRDNHAALAKPTGDEEWPDEPNEFDHTKLD